MLLTDPLRPEVSPDELKAKGTDGGHDASDQDDEGCDGAFNADGGDRRRRCARRLWLLFHLFVHQPVGHAAADQQRQVVVEQLQVGRVLLESPRGSSLKPNTGLISVKK